jgi:hypothetical protein
MHLLIQVFRVDVHTYMSLLRTYRDFTGGLSPPPSIFKPPGSYATDLHCIKEVINLST